jgi:hypothetical protein
MDMVNVGGNSPFNEKGECRYSEVCVSRACVSCNKTAQDFSLNLYRNMIHEKFNADALNAEKESEVEC